MKKIVLFIVMVLFIAGCGTTEEEEPFKIAVIPAQSVGEMEAGIEKLQTELSNSLNRPVEVESYPSYNAVVEAINYSHVDLAYLGPVTYVLAHEQSEAKAIVTQLINGEPFYYSYLITHADSELDNIDELVENSGEINFAFGSMSSTSGSVIPSIELHSRGVFRSPDDTDFKTVTYTGSHDITAESVQNKQVDVGAIDSAIFNELVESGTIDKDQFKVIWESEQLYQYPWVVPGDMDEKTVTALQEAFEAITDEEILSIFGGASAFIATSDNEYQAVVDAVQVAKEIGILEE